MWQLSLNLGAWTSWNPQGLSRPVTGLLLYLCVIKNHIREELHKNCKHLVLVTGCLVMAVIKIRTQGFWMCCCVNALGSPSVLNKCFTFIFEGYGVQEFIQSFLSGPSTLRDERQHSTTYQKTWIIIVETLNIAQLRSSHKWHWTFNQNESTLVLTTIVLNPESTKGLQWLHSLHHSETFRWDIPVVLYKGKFKGLPQQAEVAEGVPGRLRPRIFLMFSTTRVVGHQP